MLLERSRNIRKGLSKLASHSKACASATGGGFLPPTNPPKVSFELTSSVRAYAAVQSFKLFGLPPIGDSDSTTVPSTSSTTSTDGLSAGTSLVYEAALNSPILNESQSIAMDDEMPTIEFDEGGDHVALSGEAPPLAAHATPAPAATDTLSTPNPKQFFATTKQRSRKNSEIASSMQYYEEKKISWSQKMNA